MQKQDLIYRKQYMQQLHSYAQLWLARHRGCEITSPLSCPIN